MSKYSTEDLIDFIDDVCGKRDSWGRDIEILPTTIGKLVKDKTTEFFAPKSKYDGEKAYQELIARLRAADALLSAAKKVRVSVQIYADPKDYAELEKAIAAQNEIDKRCLEPVGIKPKRTLAALKGE